MTAPSNEPPKRRRSIAGRAEQKLGRAPDAQVPEGGEVKVHEDIYLDGPAIIAFLAEHPVDPNDIPPERPHSGLAIFMPESGPGWLMGLGCAICGTAPLSVLIVAMLMFFQPGGFGLAPVAAVLVSLAAGYVCLLPLLNHRARYLKIMRGTPTVAVIRAIEELEVDSREHQRVLYFYRFGEGVGWGEFVRPVMKRRFAPGDALRIKLDPDDPGVSLPFPGLGCE